MTITLSAGQADLANRAAMVAVPLVVLKVYTDRDAETVSATYYWSHVPVHYPWNAGADQYFRDLVKHISPIVDEMPHLAINGGNSLGESTMRLSLANDEIEGTYIWETLRAANLLHATVEYAEILVNPHLMMTSGGSAWWDLRSLAGNEHTYRWRGELDQVESVTEGGTIDILFTKHRPEVPIVYLLDEETNDPKDFGSPLPVVYGHAKKVPCRNITVSWVTTLAEELTKTFTGEQSVTDPTGFPKYDSFVITVDDEHILCSGSDHDANTIDITTRGYNDTRRARHSAGSMILELTSDFVCGAAGNRCTTLKQLYLANPFNQELMRVPVAYDLNTNDIGTINGKTITSFTITPDSLHGLVQSAFISSRVTVQPSYDAGVAAVGTTTQAPDHSSGAIGSESQPTFYSPGYWQNETTSTPNFVLSFASYWRYMAKDFGTATGSDTVVRWRLYLSVDIGSIPYYVDADVAGIYMRIYNVDGFKYGHELRALSSVAATVSVYTGWVEPDDKTVADLDTDNAFVRFYPTAADCEILDCYVDIETESGSVVTRTVDAEIEGPSVGFGLQFFADIDGYPVPYTYSAGYGFEEATWATTSGCTDAQVSSSPTPPEGTYAEKLTCDETIEYDCDTDRGNWTTSANGTEADAAGAFNVTSTDTNLVTTYRTTGASEDWSGKILRIDLKATQTGANAMLTDHDGVRLRLATSATGATNYEEWWFGTDDGMVDSTLHTLSLNMDDLPTADASNGTLDVADINCIHLSFNVPNCTQAIGHNLKIDQIRTSDITNIMQKVTLTGDHNVEATDDWYQLKLYTRHPEWIESARLWFDNASGSGTTVPTSRYELTIPAGALISGEFVTLEVEAIVFDNDGAGTPLCSNIETIGLEIIQKANGVQAETSSTAYIIVDDLRTADAANANYDDAPGTLIENMSDIARHFIADHCGKGHSAIDDTTFDAARANLGVVPNVYGGPVTAYGYTFEEIIGGLAFEGRGNIVAEEAAAGTVYKYHTTAIATQHYVYPAPTETIDERLNYKETTRSANEAATRLRAFWGWNPYRGTSVDAFTKTTTADDDTTWLNPPASEIVAAETAIGRRDGNPLLFMLVQDEDTMIDVLGFYIQESIRHQLRIGEFDCPMWLAYAIQRGDTKTMTRPWTGTFSGRVIGVTGSFLVPARRLTLVEVLVS